MTPSSVTFHILTNDFFLRFLETPETAFIYALTSASVMHGIAKACAKGELTECGCDRSPPSPSSAAIRSRVLLKSPISATPSLSIPFFSSTPTPAFVVPASIDGFEWGGCSDDLKFGRNVSQSFIDEQETSITRRRIVRMVNLHNNEAGRQVRLTLSRWKKHIIFYVVFFFLFAMRSRPSNEMFNWHVNVMVWVVRVHYVFVGEHCPISVWLVRSYVRNTRPPVKCAWIAGWVSSGHARTPWNYSIPPISFIFIIPRRSARRISVLVH